MKMLRWLELSFPNSISSNIHHNTYEESDDMHLLMGIAKCNSIFSAEAAVLRTGEESPTTRSRDIVWERYTYLTPYMNSIPACCNNAYCTKSAKEWRFKTAQALSSARINSALYYFNAEFSHSRSCTKYSYLNAIHKPWYFWHIVLKNSVYAIKFASIQNNLFWSQWCTIVIKLW